MFILSWELELAMLLKPRLYFVMKDKKFINIVVDNEWRLLERVIFGMVYILSFMATNTDLSIMNVFVIISLI